jgi:DNA-binding transcriptional LysR family regulator
MDWDDVRVFLAVARGGRVSVAARQLGVEHTTISRRLAALERELSAPLFHRTAGGYLLTAVGHTVLPAAETMERAATGIDARVRESTNTVAGRVRLALAPEFASDWLAPYLTAFRTRHPNIDLEILVGTRQRDLSRGEAEIAIQSPRPRQVALVSARIARATAALYASRSFVAGRRLRIDDPASAAGVPLLTYTRPLRMLQNAEWFQPVLAAARVVLETNSTHTLVAAARRGLGAAVLPGFVARWHTDLVCVSKPVAEHDIWLVMQADVRRDPKVRATAEFLKQVAPGFSEKMPRIRPL